MVQADVTGGSIRGVEHDGVARFLGVPYAAAPFGELRMRPPAPVVPWDGVRDATEYGPTPLKGPYPVQFQDLYPEPFIAGTEVLNLNVWAPADSLGSGALPVMVWIHGGAFMNGSGAVSAYDGTAFARDGVVCVTINYRLGPDGYLYTAGDVGSDNVNLGLQDQVAALRWVRENIATFGGDPERVTVAGESAGAMSVTTLLATPAAQGLFAQAITQSGAAAQILSPELGLQVAEAFAALIGTEPTREAIAAADVDRVVESAAAFVIDIQENPDPATWGPLAMRLLPFSPVVDGTILPRHPIDAISSGDYHRVPVLLGSNLQEGRLFLVPAGLIDEVADDLLEMTAGAYGMPDGALELYRRNHPTASPGDLMAQVVSDWFFRIPAIRLAEAIEQGGGTSWSYLFEGPSPEDNDGLGSAHAVEIPYVFDTVDQPEMAGLAGVKPSRAMAETTHQAWVRFVRDGDPGWAPYTTERRTTGVLHDQLTVVDDPHGDERKVWDGVL